MYKRQGHAVPEFAAIASHGTDFIRKKVTAYSMKNTGSAEFYEAINTAMDAVDALGARAGEIAARMLEDETDSARRAHLEKPVSYTHLYHVQDSCDPRRAYGDPRFLYSRVRGA